MKKIYTELEVSENVSILENKIYDLKIKRKEITQNINSIKKQIQFWENINKNQTKLF